MGDKIYFVTKEEKRGGWWMDGWMDDEETGKVHSWMDGVAIIIIMKLCTFFIPNFFSHNQLVFLVCFTL